MLFYDVSTLNVDRWLYLYACSFTAVFDIPIFVISSDMFLCWPSIWRDIQSHVRTISIWMFHKTCMFFTRSGLRTTCFWFLKLKKENGARFIVHTTFTYYFLYTVIPVLAIRLFDLFTFINYRYAYSVSNDTEIKR